MWEASSSLADRYPFVLTELGFDPNDKIVPSSYRGDLEYGRELLQYAEEKQMSWTAFVFFRGPGWPMPLFSNWDTLTPTLSGLFFKDVLAGKAISTAGDGFPDAGDPEPPTGNGPSNFSWYKWGPSAEWITPLTSSLAAVRLQGSANNQSGLVATLSWDGQPLDFGSYNQLVFNGSVDTGSAFSLAIGRTVDGQFFGCTWTLVGKGQGSYQVDLTTPEWCGPTACFDLQVANVSFATPWTTELSTVELRIESLSFGRDPARPLPQDGRIGAPGCPPCDHCLPSPALGPAQVSGPA